VISRILRKAFVVSSSIALLLSFQNWIAPQTQAPQITEERQPASVNALTHKIADMKVERSY